MGLLHIRVAERVTGQHPVGIARSLLRAVVAFLLIVSVVGLVLDLLWPIWDPFNQTLHDKAAGTAVLTVR